MLFVSVTAGSHPLDQQGGALAEVSGLSLYSIAPLQLLIIVLVISLGAGIGLANTVPVLFGAAGRLPGVVPGTAIASSASSVAARERLALPVIEAAS